MNAPSRALASLFETSDATIQNLLRAWEPQLGPPTCREGCFGCCRGLVTVHSAETPRLLAALGDQLDARRVAWRQDRAELLREERPHTDPCPLLVEGRCSAYSGRPLVCRTQAVWHRAEDCGEPGIDPCTPAELICERSQGLLRYGLAELSEGRWPFWGALSIVLELASIHGELYQAGKNIAVSQGSPYLERGLIETPPGDDPEEARRWLEEHLDVHREKSLRAAWPYGQPRGANAMSRDDLAPHILGQPDR